MAENHGQVRMKRNWNGCGEMDNSEGWVWCTKGGGDEWRQSSNDDEKEKSKNQEEDVVEWSEDGKKSSEWPCAIVSRHVKKVWIVVDKSRWDQNDGSVDYRSKILE